MWLIKHCVLLSKSAFHHCCFCNHASDIWVRNMDNICLNIEILVVHEKQLICWSGNLCPEGRWSFAVSFRLLKLSDTETPVLFLLLSSVPSILLQIKYSKGCLCIGFLFTLLNGTHHIKENQFLLVQSTGFPYSFPSL